MAVFTSFLILFLTFLQMGRHAAVTIDITPDSFNELPVADKAIHISCLPDSGIMDIKKIFLIKLAKDGEPLVFIRQGERLSYGSKNHTGFAARGQIDKNVSQSFLELTLVDPKPEDEGVYTCIMLSEDGARVVKEKKASNKLTYEKLDVKRIEEILFEKMNYVEGSLGSENLKIQQRMSELEKTSFFQTRNMSDLNTTVSLIEEQMVNLTSQVAYKCYFSVTRNDLLRPVKGQVINFPDVLLMEGKGYDTETGVFTAPRDGLYNFNLVLKTVYNGQSASVNLWVNDNQNSTITVGDYLTSGQTSMTVVTKLMTGDTVKPVVEKRTYKLVLEGRPYSFFSGYMIKPL